MSQNTTATAQPRTVQTADRGKLDVRALVLLAILLAAGFILNFTVGKAVSSISGGMISPEFIISAFCLTILVVRPNIGQALVIGLISAAVIQITTTSPFVDFAAEGIAAMLMAGIVNAAGKNGQVKPAIAIVATFLTTFVSGVIFMVIKMAMLGVVGELAAAMLPVVAMTAVFNAILVGALYLPIQKALRLQLTRSAFYEPPHLGVHSSLAYPSTLRSSFSRQPGAPRKAVSVLHHQNCPKRLAFGDVLKRLVIKERPQ